MIRSLPMARPRSKKASVDAPYASPWQGLPRYARLVLDVVDSIPEGTVRAYGHIAKELGEGGPRQVAQVMAAYGDEVPWHRVVRADGSCAPEVAQRQVPLLQDEGICFVSGTWRIVPDQRPQRPNRR
jgi:methylated-DNA-protein-cysteine methyltransferase related protein